MAAPGVDVIVIVGATGSGKTKISIEIAEKFNGEIVNADSIQMYKGLNIATAKVTLEESKGIPHHLMGFLDHQEQCDVLEYRNLATAIITDIVSRKKVPIVVGGTMYYVQALLWLASDEIHFNQEDHPNATNDSHNKSMHVDVDAKQMKKVQEEEEVMHVDIDVNQMKKVQEEEVVVKTRHIDVNGKESCVSEQPDRKLSVKNKRDDPYERLAEIDPVMAERLHPKNHRKIMKSLEIFESTGRKPSDVMLDDEEFNSTLQQRYRACILWVDCAREVLHQRLDHRVEKMLKNGLLSEVNSLRDYQKKNCFMNFDSGVFKSIGYKEFRPYFEAKETFSNLSNDSLTIQIQQQHPNSLQQQLGNEEEEIRKFPPVIQEIFKNCIHSLKSSTRQYARRQLCWIRNRLVNRNIPVYRVQSTKVENWNVEVSQPVFSIVNNFLTKKSIDYPSVQLNREPKYELTTWKKQVCEMCSKTLHGTHEWDIHLLTKGHKRNVGKWRRQNNILTEESKNSTENNN